MFPSGTEKELFNLRVEAAVAEREGRWEDAAKHTKRITEILMEHTSTARQTEVKRMEERSKALDMSLMGGLGLGLPMMMRSSFHDPSPAPKSYRRSSDDDDDKLRQQLESVVVVERPSVNWREIAGLDQVKSLLKETVILPQRFPQLFNGARKPWKGILLYGPPGTGKTHLAKAVATEADATFISVSSSDLVSKWQGESQRLIRLLFEMAREKAPSIIFIDEVDSMGGRRTDHDSTSMVQIKTEFLVQMDGLDRSGEEGKSVLVLGATNIPWMLDAAIRRRFERRVYVPLPDEGAREQLFRLNVEETENTLEDAHYKQLAKESQGMSGADISIVVRSALMEPLRMAQQATHFEVTEDGMFTPMRESKTCASCPPTEQVTCTTCRLNRRSLYDVESDKLKVPNVTMEDFQEALKNTRPSVAAHELVRFEEWTKEFAVKTD